MIALFVIFISLLLSVPLTIWAGFVLTKLWLWFIVPTFGLAPLALVPAIGVAIVASYLTNHVPRTTDNPSFGALFGHQLSVGVLVPLFALLTGWVVQMFM